MGRFDDRFVALDLQAVQEEPRDRFGGTSAVGEEVPYLACPGGAWVTGQIFQGNGVMYFWRSSLSPASRRDIARLGFTFSIMANVVRAVDPQLNGPRHV